MKLALITGVSRRMGLGFETASQLADLGYRVIVTARDLNASKRLSKVLISAGKDAVPMRLDVTDKESIRACAAEVSHFGSLDVLINNVGAHFDENGRPLESELNEVRAAFETNFFSAWAMIKEFTPLLAKAVNALVVNVSSGAGSYFDKEYGIKTREDIPVYSLTKLALNGLTLKMSYDLMRYGIKINAVCPGFTATFPGLAEAGARPVSEGARGIVWAATLPADGPTGGFFRDGIAISF